MKLILKIWILVNLAKYSSCGRVRLCWLRFNSTGLGTSSTIKFKYLSSRLFFCMDITFTSLEMMSFLMRNYSNFFLSLPAASLLSFSSRSNFCSHWRSSSLSPSIFKFNSYIFVTFSLISFLVLFIYWSFLNISFFDCINAISAAFLSPFDAT